MRFFRTSILFINLAFASQASASVLMNSIITRDYGSCETNNLRFSAMKFYKIPLKSPDNNLFLRAIFFFNNDHTFRLRLTRQELLSCQPLPSGELACSYRPINDRWLDGIFQIENENNIHTPFGVINRYSDDNNRGFSIQFSTDFEEDIASYNSFTGGMVETNFNQYGKNTLNICR